MSINTFQVPAGTAVTRTIEGFNSINRTTRITIRGRATGVVTVRGKWFPGDRLLAVPSGFSTIDLTVTQTLEVNSAATEIQIDDTANSGAALSVDVEMY
jgi:hypothetical protein